MKRILFLGLCSTLLYSCGNSKKIEIANIERLYIDYNESQGINYGSTFGATIIATMNSGEEIDVTRHKRLQISSSQISVASKTQMTIVGHPSTFEDEVIVTTLTMSDKEDSFSSTDSIALNYRGPITINAQGMDGMDGQDGRNGGTPLIGRNGRHGDHGLNGANGESGGAYTVHAWKEGEEYRLHIENDATNVVWKYKSNTTSECTFNLSGGRGGNGGDGGNGGNGKDGKINGSKVKYPGDGGNGGNGGHAGSGGNGGSLLVFVHQNAKAFLNTIQIISTGGRSGTGGNAGRAGKGGSGASGQTNGKPGYDGYEGQSSISGSSGPEPVYSESEFATESFNQ